MTVNTLDHKNEESELNIVLDYLFAHKMTFMQDFLRVHELSFSGSKSQLRQRFEEYLTGGLIQGETLITLLDRIEMWGRQHIYLYKSPDHALNSWKNEEEIRERLSDLGLIDFFNQARPLSLPPGTALSSIEWSKESLKIIWVSSHQYEYREKNRDIIEENMIWKAYAVKKARRLTIFDWDLISGDAMLMIQSVPKGTNYKSSQYDAIRREFEEKLEPIIHISQFRQIPVGQAIKKIRKSSEVRRQWLAYDTPLGGRAEFKVLEIGGDTVSDPALARADNALGDHRVGWLGDFYWNPVKGSLDNELHTRIFAFDKRIYILGQSTEREVRYAISRIRSYC